MGPQHSDQLGRRDPGKIYAPLKKLPLIDALDGAIHLYKWNPTKC